jgi:hypothetical protein
MDPDTWKSFRLFVEQGSVDGDATVTTQRLNDPPILQLIDYERKSCTRDTQAVGCG